MADTSAELHVTVPGPVRVEVDNSDQSLDAVVAAAHEATRVGVPLEIVVGHLTAGTHGDPRRAHLMRRLDRAVELARSVAPGLEVRLPVDNPLGEDTEGHGQGALPRQRDADPPQV